MGMNDNIEAYIMSILGKMEESNHGIEVFINFDGKGKYWAFKTHIMLYETGHYDRAKKERVFGVNG